MTLAARTHGHFKSLRIASDGDTCNVDLEPNTAYVAHSCYDYKFQEKDAYKEWIQEGTSDMIDTMLDSQKMVFNHNLKDSMGNNVLWIQARCYLSIPTMLNFVQCAKCLLHARFMPIFVLCSQSHAAQLRVQVCYTMYDEDKIL